MDSLCPKAAHKKLNQHTIGKGSDLNKVVNNQFAWKEAQIALISFNQKTQPPHPQTERKKLQKRLESFM